MSDAIASRPEVLVVNAMPRSSPWSRLQLVERVLAGRPAAHVTAEMGVSRATAYKWVRRHRAEGSAGMRDRSSRPHRSPSRTDPVLEATIVALRRDRRLGPARIAGIVGLPASTVHRVLVRHGMPRLAWPDRPSGEPVRRYERARPGELLHVDVKKIGRLRDGGGWRVHGRDSLERRRAREGASEWATPAWPTPRATPMTALRPARGSCAGAAAWFAAHGIAQIERVMTDNAMAYRRSAAWRDALADIGADATFTRRYQPQTNGKAERFNRPCSRSGPTPPFASVDDRAAALPIWLHTYNDHRTHTALGGASPIGSVNNVPRHYSWPHALPALTSPWTTEKRATQTGIEGAPSGQGPGSRGWRAITDHDLNRPGFSGGSV
ncbi:IS481 family transposase, partial [Actinotalea ferrariae]|uniref:IS481 family transposase n=1 Tax=Actinotalea ferrariae TaxID=1386098 RepID=UPI0027E0332B